MGQPRQGSSTSRSHRESETFAALDQEVRQLAEIAARMLGTPMAGVSLAHGDQVRVVAAVGFPAHELPAVQTFCGAVIGRRAPLVVEDAQAHERFRDLDLVTGPIGIRAYAGVPFRDVDGSVIGAVWVAEGDRRGFSASDVAGLRLVAGQARSAVQLRRASERLVVRTAERDTAHEAASYVERILGMAFERSPVPMTLRNVDGRYLRVNAAGCRILGYEPGELDGRSLDDTLVAAESDHDHRLHERLLSGELDSVVREGSYRRRDGTLVRLRVNTAVIRNAATRPVFLMSQAEDVTVRRRTDHALRATQAAGEAIVTTDATGVITSWNPGAERMFGWVEQEAVGRPLTIMIPPEHHRAHRQALERLAGGDCPQPDGQPLEFPALRRDGEHFPVELSLATWHGDDGERFHSAVIRDITARRRTQDALAASRAQQERLLSNLPGVVYSCRNEPDWPIEFISDGIVSLAGYRPDELLDGSVSFGALIHPGDRSAVWATVQQALATGESFTAIYRLITRDGAERWVWERGRLLDDAASDGRSIIEGFITDVTELQHVREAYRHSDKLLQLLSQVAMRAAEQDDFHEVVRVALRTICAAMDWPEGRAYRLEDGRLRPMDVIDGDEQVDGARPPADPRRALAVDEEGPAARAVAEGCPVWITASHDDCGGTDRTAGSGAGVAVPVLGHGRPVAVLEFGTDASADPDPRVLDVLGQIALHLGRVLERRTEEQRMRSALERETAAHRRVVELDVMKDVFLTAVNHELRTPLTVTLGVMRLLAADGEQMPEEQRRHLMERAIVHGDRLERIVEDVADLVELTGPDARRSPEATQLAQLVVEVVQAADLSDHRVTIEHRPAIVSGHAALLRRMLHCVLDNIRRHTPPGTDVLVTVEPTGDGARLEVSDSGPGIPPQLRQELLKPFTRGSTVPTHRPGLGLGLALADAIVRLHDGELELEASPSGGVTVRVRLPPPRA